MKEVPLPEDAHQLLSLLFFRTQAEQEIADAVSSGMDYNAYAKTIIERIGFNQGYSKFTNGWIDEAQYEKALVRNMKRIPMDDLVNFDKKTLEKALKTPGRHALWSRGDSSPGHTGYQRVKFLKSCIPQMIAGVFGECQTTPRQFRTDKKNHGQVQFGSKELNWIVAEDKDSELRTWLEKNPDIKKIVVIEDSIKNLAAVQKIGLEMGIEVVPVWFTNSRNGLEMKHKNSKEFIENSERFNGINNLDDVLSVAGETNQQTLFLWDLDGVLTDNIKMRYRQAEAKQKAIIDNSSLENTEQIAATFIINQLIDASKKVETKNKNNGRRHDRKALKTAAEKILDQLGIDDPKQRQRVKNVMVDYAMSQLWDAGSFFVILYRWLKKQLKEQKKTRVLTKIGIKK